ncbi:MAG: hypothetical protein HY602_00840 [Parcubacteria group bacterium]|nr:hypothetical protein [Parcubacteria group bacterium]
MAVSGELLCCFNAFIASADSKVRQELMEAVSIDESELNDWIMAKCNPRSIKRLRLSYFLESRGFEIKELLAVHPTVYEIGKLIAANKMTAQSAAHCIGYQRTDSLWRVLLGYEAISKARIAKLDILIQRHQGMSSGAEAVFSAAIPSLDCGSAITRIRQQMLQDTAALIRLLKPYTEFLDAQSTAEERIHLRDLCAGDLFPLSTMLNRLCSEKAWQTIKR